jgi:hypothetical protein
MAQGLSSKIISMINWTRTSRLSLKISFSGLGHGRQDTVSARCERGIRKEGETATETERERECKCVRVREREREDTVGLCEMGEGKRARWRGRKREKRAYSCQANLAQCCPG